MNTGNDNPNALPSENALYCALRGLLSASWSDDCSNALDTLTEAETDVVNDVVAAMVAKGKLFSNAVLLAQTDAFDISGYVSSHVETHYQRGVHNPKASAAVPTLVIVCPTCDTPVNLPPPDQRWYAVLSGLRVGWVQGWENVKQLVLHVPENKYSAYASGEDARKAFVIALATRAVYVHGPAEHAMAYDPVPANIGWLYP
ncbi:hypothetical protein VNI00_018294 [Paramarasmius palmivorus]|uniref:Uncharacterized protein n=1 Tax=Paramarasmius palmivorus TaxID=297713 RepID=A0AAW0AZQ1_9AGAR